MIQPKYSPRQALERAKLLMNYDSSKTLTENKHLLNEIEPITVGLISAGVTAALTALGIGLSEYSSADADEKIRLVSQKCDSSIPEVRRKTMSSPDWVEVAGKLRKSFTYSVLWTGMGTDLDELEEAMNLLKQKGNFGDYCEIRKLFEPKKLEDIFIDELNSREILDVVSAIEYVIAKSSAGNVKVRDEETANTSFWLDTFPCLEDTRSLSPNFTVQQDGYGNTMVPVKFKVKGQMKDFWVDQRGRVLIGTDPMSTVQSGKRVVCAGRQVTLVSESMKKKNKIREQAEFDFDITPAGSDVDDGGGGGGGGGNDIVPPRRDGCPRYTQCSGTYQKCCYSPKIIEAQRCLGIKDDGYWGPKTQLVIDSKFPQFATSFTDNDITTICRGVQPQPDRNEIEREEEFTDPNNF